METAILAVEPTLPERPSRLSQLTRQVRALQDKGLFGWLGVAAVMSPDLYPYPLSLYRTVKAALKHEARTALTKDLRKELRFQKLHVLESPLSGQRGLAEYLSQHAERKKVGVLVVCHESRRGLLSRLVQSVSEAVALASSVPVLVLKLDHEAELDSYDSTIILGVDPLHPPSPGALAHVAVSARLMGSVVHLVTVRPKRKAFRKAISDYAPSRLVLKELGRIQRLLHLAGLETRFEVFSQAGSVAEGLEAYAERHQACMIAVTSPKRRFLRRALVGSTIRGLIRRSKRPTLVLRTA